MSIQQDAIFANLVMGELVRSSRSLTIWSQGRDAPISVMPAIDVYVGTLTMGQTVMVGFHVKCTGKRIWLNVGSITRIDVDPLPARANVTDQQAATAPVAPEQEG
jgi:hypothetical protein